MKQKVKYLLLALVSCALLCGIVVAANRKAQEYQLSVSTCFIMDTVIEQSCTAETRSRQQQKSNAVCGSMNNSIRCIFPTAKSAVSMSRRARITPR